MMRTKHEHVKTERNDAVEMMVDIYENAETIRRAHDFRRTNTETHQSLHTGSVSMKNTKHRLAEVCLCVLCVLLLTAVIVLCVCYTNERKHFLTHIHNLTEERKQILKHNNNLTEEREQILNRNINLTEEREQILKHNKNLTEEKKHITKHINKLTEEREQIKNKTDQILHAFKKQDQLDDQFKWIYYNFSFYYISSEPKGWSDSRRYCQQRGADLLIIKSPEEQEFLQKAVADGHFWIGLTKTKGVWTWTDNTTVTNEYWRNQSQDFYIYCAVMTSSGWKDESCTSVMKWICKRSIVV